MSKVIWYLSFSILWPNNSTSGYLSEGNTNTNLRRWVHRLCIATLFRITKIWKQSTCPLIDAWIQKIWYMIYTHTYIEWNIYSAIKIWNITVCDNMVEPSGHYANGLMKYWVLDFSYLFLFLFWTLYHLFFRNDTRISPKSLINSYQWNLVESGRIKIAH